MLRRPQDLPIAHDIHLASSIPHRYRCDYYQQQHNPYQDPTVARLQPVRTCDINSFNSFEVTWNAAKAKLVARWETINARREHRHRLKRSMVKKLTLLRNSVTKPHLLGPTSAGDPHSSVSTLVTCPDRAEAEEIFSVDEGSKRCLAELNVYTEELNIQNDGSKLGDISQKQPRSAGPMESEKKASAAQGLSHCQLDRTDAYEASEASGSSAGSSSKAEPGNGDSGQGRSTRSTRAKRRLDGDDQDNSSTGGDEGDPDRGGSKRAKKDTEPDRRFACPFYKYNPKAHSKHRSCAGPGWASLHRLKEHLYRAHRLPKHTCPRCNEPFEDSKDLSEHIRADVPCERLDVVPALQGIDEATEAKLKVRKKNCPEKTDEERWRDIYMILFPDAKVHTMPTPYYDGNDSLGFSKNAEEWRKVRKRMEKELPKLVQKKVERSFEKVEVDVLDRLPDIIRDGLFEFFKDMPHDDRSPSATPAATPRARTPGFPTPAVEEQPVASTGEIKDISLDISPYFDLNGSFFGVLDDFDTFNFDFGSSVECRPTDRESDSGYASTSTGRDGTVETEN